MCNLLTNSHFGRTWHTMEREDSSSLSLSRQSDRDGDLRGGHLGALSQVGDSSGVGSRDGVTGGPRHHDTSAGATPTTTARLSFTIAEVPKFRSSSSQT